MIQHRWLFVVLVVCVLGLGWSCESGRGRTESPKPDGSPLVDAGPDVTKGPDVGKPDVGSPDVGSPDLTGPAERREPPTPAKLTYHKDVRAIVEVKCLGCHQEGGVGPFALDDYKKLYGTRQAVASAVKDGRMPPWMGKKSCNEYTNDISLSTAQRDTIVKWVAEGAEEGDPKDYVAPPKGPGIGLSRVDSVLKMKKPYVPKRTPDDHRCFVLDWPHKTVKYISGFGIKAGKLDMVHHVIAYLAHPKHADKYTQKDPNGEGYRCTGTAGGNAGLNWIGVWAPGVPGGNYPKGTGLQVDPGSKIVVQIHYNTTSVKPVADQSSVEFKLEDKVDKRALMVPFADYINWLRNNGMKIPKDDSAKTHSYTLQVSFLSVLIPGLKELTIYGAMLHMHQLGSKGSLSLNVDGGDQCLLDIPRWDFNWQLMYDLKKPITLTGSDKISISCTYNNSAANQPIVDGKKQESRDVFWGDGTNDEMCLGVLYVTCGDTPCPKLDSF